MGLLVLPAGFTQGTMAIHAALWHLACYFCMSLARCPCWAPGFPHSFECSLLKNSECLKQKNKREHPSYCAMAQLTQVPGCQPHQGPWLSSLAGGEDVNRGAGRGCPLQSRPFLAERLAELPAHVLEEDNHVYLARNVERG